MIVNNILSKVKAHQKFMHQNSSSLSSRARKTCVQPLFYVTSIILDPRGMLVLPKALKIQIAQIKSLDSSITLDPDQG